MVRYALLRGEGVSPEGVWGKSRQAEGRRAHAKALRYKQVWCAQGTAEWQHGVQVREDGGSGQGGRSQCSSEDNQQLAEGPDRVVKEGDSPPGIQPRPQEA